MSRYRYYINNNEVVCVSHYAGKAVRGVAKCSPEDQFNEEFGKTLARLRCDKKVAKLRFKRASKLYSEAEAMVDAAEDLLDKRDEYYCDAGQALDDASDALAEFLSDAEIESSIIRTETIVI